MAMRSRAPSSNALTWVLNGRAAAPPLVCCSTGVSTSMYSRASSVARSDCSTLALTRTFSRASGRTMRST